MPEHVRTRTRGCDDVTRCILKTFDRMFRNGTRILAKTCVELWLSATSLIAGKGHVDAEAVENVHDGLARLREE